MKNIILWTSYSICSFILFSCTSNTNEVINNKQYDSIPISEKVFNFRDVADVRWRLREMNERDYFQFQVTLQISQDDTKRDNAGDVFLLNGTGFCNQYFTSISFENMKMHMSPLGSTQMMCFADDASISLDSLEIEYFTILEKAQYIYRIADMLFIESSSDILYFIIDESIPPQSNFDENAAVTILE